MLFLKFPELFYKFIFNCMMLISFVFYMNTKFSPKLSYKSSKETSLEFILDIFYSIQVIRLFFILMMRAAVFVHFHVW